MVIISTVNAHDCKVFVVVINKRRSHSNYMFSLTTRKIFRDSVKHPITSRFLQFCTQCNLHQDGASDNGSLQHVNCSQRHSIFRHIYNTHSPDG